MAEMKMKHVVAVMAALAAVVSLSAAGPAQASSGQHRCSFKSGSMLLTVSRCHEYGGRVTSGVVPPPRVACGWATVGVTAGGAVHSARVTASTAATCPVARRLCRITNLQEGTSPAYEGWHQVSYVTGMPLTIVWMKGLRLVRCVSR
jgi:hypothetical protein